MADLSQSFFDSLQHTFEADDFQPFTRTVEQRHVDSLLRQYQALATGNLPDFLTELDPEVEMEIHAPPLFPWIRRARGEKEVRAAVLHNFATLEDQQPVILRTVAQGYLVDVTLQETGRIKATGQRYDIVGVQQFTFRNGKVHKVREMLACRTPEE